MPVSRRRLNLMLFPTLSFAAFFAVVLPVSWLLMPSRVRWRLFMVAASWFFYGAADWRFVPLLAASTIVNHYFARRIYRATGRNRRTWTITAVATNLAVLAWFKYIGFLSLSAQSGLRFFGIQAHVPLPEVLLPIGISFFTFQALSYVIDTSRGKIQPVSLLEFAVYLSFFPHLVAGPIVRATEFLPQIKERISPRHVDVGKAFWLISLGLFKKVVIASYLGTYAADPLFGFPRQHAGVEALFGVYAYAIQIYADFSGYTDIAIGLALLLGIRFPQNFNAPYAAASLQDFWRRWHMTLSRWLRDYLYIPLGGSRRGRVRTYVNIMVTMLLGGLWHGAAWTFVAWGALHGLGLIVERWRGERPSPPPVEEGGKGDEPPAGAPPPPPLVATAPTARRPRVLAVARDRVEATVTASLSRTPNGSAVDVESRPEPAEAAAPSAPPSRSDAQSVPPPSDEVETVISGGELWDTMTAGRGRPRVARTWVATAVAPAAKSGANSDLTTKTSESPAPLGGGADEAASTSQPSVIAPAPWSASARVRSRRGSATQVSTPTMSDPVSRSASSSGSESRSGTESGSGSEPGSGSLTTSGSESRSGANAGPEPDSGSSSESSTDSDSGSGSEPGSGSGSGARFGSVAVGDRGSSAGAGKPGRPFAVDWPVLSPGARVWVGRLITFHVVCLAWVFFRATTFHNAIEVLGRIVSIGGHHRPFNWKVAAVVVGALAVQLGPRGFGPRLQVLFSKTPFWVQALLLAGALTVIDLLGPAGVAPFIYFRF